MPIIARWGWQVGLIWLGSLAVFAAGAAGAAGGTDAMKRKPSGPVTLDRSAAAKITREIEKDRKDTEKWLRREPTSYLATILRLDFGDRTALTVGRAEDNDIRLEGAGVEPHHLRVAVEGDRFRVRAVDPRARFQAGKESKREAVLEPSSVRVGRYTLRLSHQRFPAIIVFDPKSPRFKEYKGLRYFPVDLRYRYELPLVPETAPDTLVIMSTRGNPRRAVTAGWFEFLADGTPCRLRAVRLLEPGVGEDDISVFFRDATTGTESYPVGRYVDVKKLAGGDYLMDFNMAYNPACAFSDHYNCPIPPEGNTLPVAIRAGEMDSHYH
jgi:hypothetical protein